MVKVIWTQRSLKDLEDIGEYIAQDSVKYSKRTLEKIIATASLIEINPLMGRIVPETNEKSIRELIKGNYRIIYQIREKATFILTIYHSARNLTEENLK
jgi:addiction module RelE/StbE family toxin